MSKVLLPIILFSLNGWYDSDVISSTERASTAAYIQALQNPDGGFAPSPGKESDLGSTTSALRALRDLGEKPKDLRKCDAFVQRCFARTGERGSFGSKPGGEGDVRSTAMGLMSLEVLGNLNATYVKGATAYLEEHVSTFEDIRIAAAAFEAVEKEPRKGDEWAAMIRKTQRDDSTFGMNGTIARDTGGAVVALLRLGHSIGNREAIVDALKNGQQKDGGFSKDGVMSSDLETSYRIMRAFHMLKTHPSVPRLLTFVASCRNRDGGYGISPGQPSSASTTYFAITILSWVSEQ